MRFLARNLVTLLLIAVMAMPAVSSPALRHRHADGDKSHRHGVETVERDGHSHSAPLSDRVGTTTAKHAHDERVSDSAQLQVEHLHVFWFGFQTSMPLSAPESSDSPRPMVSTEQWVPLISEVTLPDGAQDELDMLAIDLSTPTGLTPRLLARSEVRPPHESVVALLCDTARRERSGVLVI